MDQKNNDIIEIDIKELFFVLLRKWYVILIIGILGALITGIISNLFITPIFTSTSKLYIINRQQDDITTWSDMQSGEFLAKDFRVLVKSRPVTEEVIRNLKLNMTHEQLTSMISIHTPEETRILDIMVSYTDPGMAKKIVDEVARVSSEQLVNIMEIKKINIVEEGNLPLSPTGPNVGRNTFIGGTLGIFLSSFILLVLHIMNDTIRSSEEIEKYLGLTVLGLIPIEEGTPHNKKIKQYKPGKRNSKKKTKELVKEEQDHATSDI